MSKRDHRPKASDVFRDSRLLFGKITFREAFPTIKKVRVEVTQTKDPIWQKQKSVSVYDETNLGEYVDCRNTLCYNGGISVGEMLRKMVHDQKTEAEFSSLCGGYEGSPKGYRKYRNCSISFGVKIKIEYRPPVHIDPNQII